MLRRDPAHSGAVWFAALRLLAVTLTCVALATCSRPPTLLEEVRQLGELRVVTWVSPTTYYQGPNGPLGVEYELVSGFADYLGVQLRIEPLERFADLIPAVETGRAHIAAAGLTMTEERAQRVDFGPAYQTVKQSLIYKLGTGKPRELDDLIGKHVEVGVGTSFVDRLALLQQREPKIVFTENPSADVAELLLAVARGEIDHTVADSNQVQIYRNLAPEIRVAFDLASGDSLSWALPRRFDNTLVNAVKDYFAKIASNGQLDRIMDRYYGHANRFDYVGTRRFIRDTRNKLPKYRPLFEQAAQAIDSDWRLLAAIGYQESHWDPEAVSPTGVRGIMMLTESTANVIGIADRIDPAQSIVGGADYLRRMKRRLPDDIREPDRTWFALAAYNIGLTHVQDARRIARDAGDDPNLWVNVRGNFEKLAQRRWYQQTQHGFAPGWEPVRYVENVRNYYDILRWLSWREERRQRQQGITLVSNSAGQSPQLPAGPEKRL